MGLLKALQIKVLRAAIATVGQLSDGIRLATKEGFISGLTLEYIYKNLTNGKTFIGRWIDKKFIRHPGWQDVRDRKENLEKLLKKAVETQLQTTGTVRICDVASGPARYVLETLDAFRNDAVSAELRDVDERWLDEARRNADALGLDPAKLTTRRGDALSPADFHFDVRPNIFVASGFYDWFDDDEKIKTSMRLIFDAAEKGAFFLFTNQSGHVDLALINGVFTDFNGEPLKMTVRPAEKLETWAREIGFQTLETKSDERSRYSTTLAQK